MESENTEFAQRIDERSKAYSNPFASDDYKKRKDQHEVELRKSKRADLAIKRRNLAVPEKEWIPVNEHFKESYTLEDLSSLLQAANSSQDTDLLMAAQGFRKLLSIKVNPPIQNVIDAGVIPFLITWIQRSDYPQLQYEASWCLTNIASGNHMQTLAIIEKGAVPVLVNMLSSPLDELKEQSIWTLGNIGADSAHCRDLILQFGAMRGLINASETSQRKITKKQGLWTISNLCRGKPMPQFEFVKESIPVITKALYEFPDEEILPDLLWALSCLSDGNPEGVQMIIDSGALPKVTELTKADNYRVQLPGARCLGNIISGYDIQAQAVVEAGGVEALASLLDIKLKNLRKEAVWALSNLCAGTKEQLQYLIEKQVTRKLIEIASIEDRVIQKEVVWAIANAVSNGKPEQVDMLVQQNAIEALCFLLQLEDTKLISVALEGLGCVLRVGNVCIEREEAENPYTRIVEECGGLVTLEKLQMNPNNNIYNKALKIIETYFGVEEDESKGLIDLITKDFTF